jgi:3-dehydroquinate dehydratase-2
MRRIRVAVVHGVNLDQLGRRNPDHYGAGSLRDLERQVEEWGTELGCAVRFFQTNHEGAFVEYLHRAEGLVDALILNPGAWTHYSWAIHDALELASLPAVEVHLSDVGAREEWRRRSVISELCLATVSGQGVAGYRTALEALVGHLLPDEPEPLADAPPQEPDRAETSPAPAGGTASTDSPTSTDLPTP